RRERIPLDHRLERLPAQRIAPEGGREPIGDRRDHRRQPSRVVEHAGLYERTRCVQPAIGVGQHAVQDLAVLPLGSGLVESSKTPTRVEIRDPAAFDEDLLEVGARQELGQWPVIGDGTNDPLDHLRRVGQGPSSPHVRPTLIFAHGIAYQFTHLEAIRGVHSHLLQQADRPPPDLLVGVAHNPTSSTNFATARTNGPLATGAPAQVASSTRLSSGRTTIGTAGRMRLNSPRTSLRRYEDRGTRFKARTRGVSGAIRDASAAQRTKRDNDTGSDLPTPTRTSARRTMLRLNPNLPSPS